MATERGGDGLHDLIAQGTVGLLSADLVELGQVLDFNNWFHTLSPQSTQRAPRKPLKTNMFTTDFHGIALNSQNTLLIKSNFSPPKLNRRPTRKLVVFSNNLVQVLYILPVQHQLS